MNGLKLAAIFIFGAILVGLLTYGAMKAAKEVERTIALGISNMTQPVE